MIERITGKIIQNKPPVVIIETYGIGYEIECPMPDCAKFSELDNIDTTIYIHQIIKEDGNTLYGFISINTRNAFRELIKVSGIGAKIGLALLSTLSVADISLAIQNKDTAILCQTPGIGKKMAERMILELKDKTWIESNLNNPASAQNDNHTINNTYHADISDALRSLGYTDKVISVTLKKLPNTFINLSTGIKDALKLLSQSS